MKKERHKPEWTMENEREYAAGNLGPTETQDEDTGSARLVAETVNVTSANTNRKTILDRKVHMQFIQEMCLAKAQREAMKKEAKAAGKNFIGGPTDPEQAKAAAGVGALSVEGLGIYSVPKPISDYADAEATGRCKIVCCDVGGCTLAIAIVYGWTGGTKGSSEAARTDDILTIIQMQFDSMPPGPKAIAGDLNGSIEAFPTLAIMLEEQGWTDIGNDSSKCGGKPGQPTCQANDGVKESRIDYFIANDRLTPAVVSCKVDHGWGL